MASATDIAIPETATIDGISYPVSTIADEAFSSAATLTSIDLPETITTIGARAFAGTALTSLVLPQNVMFIGSGAFDGLNNNIIVAKGSVAVVAPDVFGTSAGMKVYVPYNTSETYAWPASVPAAGNRLLPYGVQLNPSALKLNIGETANLFDEPGYLYAPGNIRVTYSYSAKTVKVDTSTGEITAKRPGRMNVDVSIHLPLDT